MVHWPKLLSIRKWEPKFNSNKADCKITAIWARLPLLPLEFYDHKVLQQIGNTMGDIIKIDAHTNHAIRGQFARICVQVAVDKPLPWTSTSKIPAETKNSGSYRRSHSTSHIRRY